MTPFDRLKALRRVEPFEALDLRFDSERMSIDLAVADRLGFGPDKPQICLTSRAGSSDPLFDGAGSLIGRGTEDEFTEFNSAFGGTIFEEIHRSLPVRVGRTRLMFMAPGRCYTFHRDTSPRLHLAISTNDQSFLLLEVDGKFERLHIPADGQIWRVDTRRIHTAMNAGPNPRIHWVAAILS
jgi:hypothetical protein